MKILGTPYEALLGNILVAIGVGGRDPGTRLDASETAFFARSLEHVMARTYDIKRPLSKARQYIPVDTSVPSGAQSFTYQQWDALGVAALLANYAEDLPNVEVFGKEFTAPIRGLGSSYLYSVQDLRAAQMARVDLNGKKANKARDTIERQIDDIAAFGKYTDSAGTLVAIPGFVGFVNHPSVPVVPKVSAGAWSASTTAANLGTDLRKLISSIKPLTKGVEQGDTLLLPLSVEGFLKTPVGPDNQETVLSAFLRNNPEVKAVDFWHKLDTASALGGPRAVWYRRDPEVLELVIPQEFEQFPPQQRNLAFAVPCHARVGGVSVHYPLSIAYMDLDTA